MLVRTLRSRNPACDRMLGTRALVLLVLALGGGSRVDGQLLADAKQFLGTLPTFYSVDRSVAPRPATPGPSGAPDVNLLAVATNATALMDRRASITCGATWCSRHRLAGVSLSGLVAFLGLGMQCQARLVVPVLPLPQPSQTRIRV